ncbi:MAG: hypothetical protein ABGW74_07870, partial [Campylobacterales bacterium]
MIASESFFCVTDAKAMMTIPIKTLSIKNSNENEDKGYIGITCLDIVYLKSERFELDSLETVFDYDGDLSYIGK